MGVWTVKPSVTPKPQRRSDLRMRLGTTLFCLRRRVFWYTGGLRFARPRSELELPHLWAEHRTPLFRPLRGEEMALQRNKLTNLRLALARLDGLTLLPGETLSFWRAVGKPTRRKGYVEGMILRNGQVAAGVGGGMCQMTNLIYWMTLHTPLTVTERWRHGYDVFPDCSRTQPFGSGATCFYNYMDLMVRNDTEYTWRLSLRLTDTHLEGEWRADVPSDRRYEVYEKEHYIQGEYWGGFTRHNTLYRRCYTRTGELLADEYVVENHAMMMYDPMLPGNTPETTVSK